MKNNGNNKLREEFVTEVKSRLIGPSAWPC